MKRKRRVWSAVLALCFLLTLFPAPTRAVTIVASGGCGAEKAEDLIWTLDEEGNLVFRGGGAMKDYSSYDYAPWYSRRSSIKTITIPSGVTNIGSYAFWDIDGVSEISIPDGVTSIGSRAFYDMNGVSEISIPETAASIGESAFSGCGGLTSLTIPNAVTSIGAGAFYDNPNLTLTVYIDSYAETYCLLHSLRHVVSGKEGIVYVASGGCGAEKAEDLIWTLDEEGNLVFRGGGAMEEYSLYYHVPWYSRRSSIKTITIPSGVTNIGSYAFGDIDGVSEISIPDGVTSIGRNAFYGMNGVSEISIPETAASIGESAFSGCGGLASLTIPNAVTSIGASAFYDNPNLTLTVYIDSYAETYCLLNSIPHNAVVYHNADATGVEVSPASASIEVGQTVQLSANVKPVNAKNTNVTWNSLSPTVASVDESGLVTGLTVGEAHIMATSEDGGFTSFCKVTVTPVTPVTSVTLDKSLIVLDVGGTDTLTATITPENASNKAVTWTSSDDSIVSVDENGVVTMKAQGAALITVTTADGGFTASCTVSTPVSPTGIELDNTSLAVYPGKSAVLTATLQPENATSRTVRWSSTDPDIASVDGNGTVTAVKPGTAAIVAACADGGAFAVCMVAVEASGSVTFVSGDKELAGIPEENTPVSASFKMDGFSEEGGSAVVNVFLAVYDRKGLMVDLRSWETALSNTGTVFMRDVDIPEGVQVGKIRIMILSDDMVPLMAASFLG